MQLSFAEWDACAGRRCSRTDGAEVAPEASDDRARRTPLRPSDDGWGRGGRPVINVSWNDAKAYVAWLREKTGVVYRLLSETEWEYAARAGTTESRIWGAAVELACQNGNTLDRSAEISADATARSHACEDGYAATAPVGSYAANRFALHDMVGNVSEWVEDCWYLGYVGAPADGSARSPSRSPRRPSDGAHRAPFTRRLSRPWPPRRELAQRPRRDPRRQPRRRPQDLSRELYWLQGRQKGALEPFST